MKFGLIGLLVLCSTSGAIAQGVHPCDRPPRPYVQDKLRDFADRLNDKDPDVKHATARALMQLSPNITQEIAVAMATNPTFMHMMLPRLLKECDARKRLPKKDWPAGVRDE